MDKPKVPMFDNSARDPQEDWSSKKFIFGIEMIEYVRYLEGLLETYDKGWAE